MTTYRCRGCSRGIIPTDSRNLCEECADDRTTVRWYIVDDIGSIVSGPFPSKADAERLDPPWGGETVMTPNEWFDTWGRHYDDDPFTGKETTTP